MLQSLRELHVLGQRMDADVALSFAVGAVALAGDVLLFALGVLFVERRGDLHSVADGAAVAVEVVGAVDPVGRWPREVHSCGGLLVLV